MSPSTGCCLSRALGQLVGRGLASTHAHTEHLFTPVEVQGALFFINTVEEEGICLG